MKTDKLIMWFLSLLHFLQDAHNLLTTKSDIWILLLLVANKVRRDPVLTMTWSWPNENVIHQTRDLYGRACHQNNRSRRWCQKSQTLVSIVVSVTQDKIRQTLSRGDIRPLYLFWAPGSRGPWWAARQQALGCLGTYWQQVVQSRTGGQLGWAVGRVPHHSSWMPSSLKNVVPSNLIFGCIGIW